MITEISYSLPSRWFRHLLTLIGSRLDYGTLSKCESVINYMMVGFWLKSMNYTPLQWATNRSDLFRKLVKLKNLDAAEVLYLEFGVYKGDSSRFWANLLNNPKSRLLGFDTFYGLPESWGAFVEAGTFSTNGAIPDVDDSRIQFIKGNFKDSLKNFKLPPHNILLINVDCDLYSSTWEIFLALEAQIVPGTLIYFDEIFDRNNELKAFVEFLKKSKAKFKLLIADRTGAHMVFERVADSR